MSGPDYSVVDRKVDPVLTLFLEKDDQGPTDTGVVPVPLPPSGRPSSPFSPLTAKDTRVKDGGQTQGQSRHPEWNENLCPTRSLDPGTLESPVFSPGIETRPDTSGTTNERGGNLGERHREDHRRVEVKVCHGTGRGSEVTVFTKSSFLGY